MLKNFDWAFFRRHRNSNPVGFRLKIVIFSLVILNLATMFLFFFPPGGSRSDLNEELLQTRNEIQVRGRQSVRLQSVSRRIVAGSLQGADFKSRCILPKRVAYGQVIEEIQRMSKAASLEERDGVFSEEPIEGTVDLSLLNMTANYQGSYDNLMAFLSEADHSPMLLMLDNLQASPQQKGDQIDVSIRFQAVIRDSSVVLGDVGR